MKVAVLYGSTTGTTENAAELIKANMSHEVSLMNVAAMNPTIVDEADLVLLGSSTWGYGDLQEDFSNYIEEIQSDNYGGKKVAVFGSGDSKGFGDVFCEAVKIITDHLQGVGAEIIAEPLLIDGNLEDNIEDIIAFAHQF